MVPIQINPGPPMSKESVPAVGPVSLHDHSANEVSGVAPDDDKHRHVAIPGLFADVYCFAKRNSKSTSLRDVIS